MGAFGPVWTALYASTGYASSLIYQDGADSTALGLYTSQLALNWAWTPIFFGMHSLKFYSINKIAGLLFVPYFLWVSLATALTFTIWKKNGDNPKPEIVKKE